MTPAIVTGRLTRTFNGVEAVNHLDLEVPQMPDQRFVYLQVRPA